MAKIEGHTEKKWFIAKCNSGATVHYGELEVGQVVETGQPNLTCYDTEQEYLDALEILGITLE